MAVQSGVLEFYPVRSIDFAAYPILSTAIPGAAGLRGRCLACAVAATVLLGIGGCASAPTGGAGSGSAPVPANVEPPPANVNLSGFPLPYRQGYADGCASAGGSERKDAARFGSDGNYRTGWQDGVALCRKR
jgi:hypothetical protein